MNQEQAKRLIALLEDMLAEMRATRELLARLVEQKQPIVTPIRDLLVGEPR